jgi:glutathione peroxidase
MKQIASLIITVMLLNPIFAQTKTMKTFHDFKTTTIEGKEFDLKQLNGKKVLVVNTASKCGNTPQYAELEKMYQKYKGQNFTIIGFPANNFGKQEPGTNTEIADFCKKNYGVTFQMMSKISVKGDDMDPIYQWLTRKDQNGVADAEVKWNFQKFMIDENGKWIDFVDADETPMTDKIIKWIEKKN